MSFLLGFFLFLLIFGLFILLIIVSFFRSLFSFGRKKPSRPASERDAEFTKRNVREKIFDKNEGEYVDYEEINEE